jgi:hypothetical protein
MGRREALEQDCPGDHLEETAGHEQVPDEALGAAGNATVDDVGDAAADSERAPDGLALGEHFTEHRGREQRGEHKIGAGDKSRHDTLRMPM